MARTQNTKAQKKSQTPVKQNPLKKTKLKKRKFEPIPSSSPPPADSTSDDSDSADDSDSDSFSDFDPADLPALLEPFTKEQLVELITAAAAPDSPSLYSLINERADRDVSHRKIFVHGLPWDATRETLISVFEPFGEIEDCKVITDKVTNRAKGYAFVMLKTRKAAIQALKEPKKLICNRLVSCQLASVGPVNAGKEQDVALRKIYVSKVGPGADKDKLRDFFEMFGEIEVGPIGFDEETGRSKGYALFVYKTVEGARKALEEPYKAFEGLPLHCSLASVGKNKASNSSTGNNNQMQGKQLVAVQQQQQQQQVHQPSPPQLMAAVAAAQNMGFFGQHPGLNPLYSGLLGSSTGGIGGGMINPLMGSVLNSHGVMTTNQAGGLGVGNQSVLGSYRSVQGLQYAYMNAQTGPPTAGRSGLGNGGSSSGYASNIWYGLLGAYDDTSFAFNFLIMCFYACSSFVPISFAILIAFPCLKRLKFGRNPAQVSWKNSCIFIVYSNSLMFFVLSGLVVESYTKVLKNISTKINTYHAGFLLCSLWFRKTIVQHNADGVLIYSMNPCMKFPMTLLSFSCASN